MRVSLVPDILCPSLLVFDIPLTVRLSLRARATFPPTTTAVPPPRALHVSFCYPSARLPAGPLPCVSARRRCRGVEVLNGVAGGETATFAQILQPPSPAFLAPRGGLHLQIISQFMVTAYRFSLLCWRERGAVRSRGELAETQGRRRRDGRTRRRVRNNNNNKQQHAGRRPGRSRGRAD